ncbi:TRAP transporter substrate-binding protein [Aquamicrobium ahrensii]|uniref:TRAP-type C4-dicarboxylate transport system substrate-binding protein n=1 Tax=Aquamicrobium ahrensii TaxID=469551 RepID=A0ABV2KK02_9HYPH
MLKHVLATLTIALGSGAGAMAQDLPKTHFKVIGLNSPTPVSTVDELPFWRTTIPDASNGSITADITPQDLMGIDEAAGLRLLKLGVMDFAGLDISKMAGDDPRFEGCDLAGLTLTPDEARKACDAYRDVIDQQMQKNWNAKLLAFGGNNPQVFWCRDNISSLEDLRGKKVRVFNNSMRDFLSGVGATAVSMSFAEAVPALSNGVIDCAVTGTLSGNIGGLNEVASTLYAIPLGWSIVIQAVNLNTWNRLDPDVQQFMQDQFRAFEHKMWETVKLTTEEAVNCNTGKEPCTMGKLAQISIVTPGEQDEAARMKLLQDAIIPGWAQRCGAECAQEWNESVGKALGASAPAP